MLDITKGLIAVAALWIGTGLISKAVAASDDVNAPRTLKAYLREAALRNAGLRAAFESWKASLEEIPQARALPDPRFNYGYFIEEVETRVGPQEHRVGISQVFPWFGKIAARTDAAAAGAEAARRRYDARKLKLFSEVKDRFFEYLYLRRAIDIAQDNLELVRHFEEVARTKYITATADHPDVIRAQIELATLQDKLEELTELRGPIVARLNALLDRSVDAPLPWPTPPPKGDVAPIDRQALHEGLKRNNPELQARDLDLKSARHRIELAKKRFYPDLGVGVDWIATGDAVAAGVSDSGKDPVILMFSMNLPIWRESYGGRQLQARAAARRVEHDRRELESDLLARLERAIFDYEDSTRRLRLYEDALVPKAEQLLGASETAYTAGTVDFLSLIDAEQTLLRFRLKAARVEADRMQSLARLESLLGTELP
jgi:outer membrane protein TolC